MNRRYELYAQCFQATSTLAIALTSHQCIAEITITQRMSIQDVPYPSGTSVL